MNMKDVYEKLQKKMTDLPEIYESLDLEKLEAVQKAIENLGEEFDSMSLVEKCNFYEKFVDDIKKLVDSRQTLTRPYKAAVKNIEKKFFPFVRGLENLKAKCHENISEEIIRNEEVYTNDEGYLSYVTNGVIVQETEPKRTFKIRNVSEICEEFLLINEEAVEEYYRLYGAIPSGIDMIETRKCSITRLRKK